MTIKLLPQQEKLLLTAVDDKLSYIFFDIDNLDVNKNYFSYFDNPDLLIHLAWQGLPNYKSLFHFENNLPVHYSFLKNMVVNGLKNMVVTGTCFEYGIRARLSYPKT